MFWELVYAQLPFRRHLYLYKLSTLSKIFCTFSEIAFSNKLLPAAFKNGLKYRLFTNKFSKPIKIPIYFCNVEHVRKKRQRYINNLGWIMFMLKSCTFLLPIINGIYAKILCSMYCPADQRQEPTTDLRFPWFTQNRFNG